MDQENRGRKLYQFVKNISERKETYLMLVPQWVLCLDHLKKTTGI